MAHRLVQFRLQFRAYHYPKSRQTPREHGQEVRRTEQRRVEEESPFCLSGFQSGSFSAEDKFNAVANAAAVEIPRDRARALRLKRGTDDHVEPTRQTGGGAKIAIFAAQSQSN